MNRQYLIREYKKLSNLPHLNMRYKARKRMDEIEEELKVFIFGDKILFSGGALVTLQVIKSLANGDRDKFIQIEKEKGKKQKNYPSEDWIRTTRIIKRVEKSLGVRFYYDWDKDKLFQRMVVS